MSEVLRDGDHIRVVIHGPFDAGFGEYSIENLIAGWKSDGCVPLLDEDVVSVEVVTP